MSRDDPTGTFTVCTDGEAYPADLTDPAVESAVHAAIAAEIAKRIGAPAGCVDAVEVDFWRGTGYVEVTVTIQAPYAGGAS